MIKLLTAERFVDMNTGCSYRYVNSETERFKFHTHDYYEIFIMLEGRAVHFINGEEVRLNSRDIVFIRASDFHHYAPLTKEPFSFLNITFTKETMDLIFSYLAEGYPKRRLMNSKYAPMMTLTGEEFESISREMEKIRALLPEDSKRRKTALRILIMKLFSDVFERFIPREREIPEWLVLLSDKMESRTNFEGGISRMSELSGKSREHVARSIKKYYGKTPSEFINELRLNYITNMLKNSNHKILDIVLEAGFNNLSYASVLFLKRYGMTMSEFRRNNL